MQNIEESSNNSCKNNYSYKCIENCVQWILEVKIKYNKEEIILVIFLN